MTKLNQKPKKAAPFLPEQKQGIVYKNYLLIKKPCGAYRCPHYFDPAVAGVMLRDLHVEADPKTIKFFAEVIENFGLQIAKDFQGGKITSRQLSDWVKRLEIA